MIKIKNQHHILLWSILTIAVLLFAGACKKTHKDDIKLATVGSNDLYLSDLNGLFKKGLTAPDSIALAKSYIDKWIRKQLLIQRAELNLTDDDKDVEKEIEEYRSSLLIYRYEQSLVEQKLDSVVKDPEIEQYYQQNESNFVLSDALVKAVLIKIPLNAPHIEKVQSWYKSDKAEDIAALESYCYQYAKTYDVFNDDWVYLGQLTQFVPIVIGDKNEFLKSTKCIETKDSVFRYFVNIKEYKLIGSTASLKLVKADIKTIILNKRKMMFINGLEDEIYNDALSKKTFKIYNLK
jgi:hypothetical protein